MEDGMKKLIKGKFVDGAVRLLEDFRLDENEEVYIIVEGKEEKSILEETFGIWVDDPDYLEKLREESGIRIKRLGIN
ncbi:MAG TPA: DUF104 domain-containing protein [Nitrospirae bacterium]|nr:DUF104 domain-containing protein [Nitrospirota bacterium]